MVPSSLLLYVIGLMRYMALSGMQRKMDTQGYISRWKET